ncbi:MAG TPA: hypothetical protein VMV94_08795 [Phycisphaerae bacterium]|nr:hypothetical protein [Phycisphaerae bacterium]
MAVLAITAVAAMVVFAAPGIVAAQQPQGVRSPSPAPAQPMSLAQAERPKSEQTAVKTAERTVETTSTGEDEVAERQSIDTWSSIEDGQPGAPGELEIHLASGWQTRSGEHDPVFLHPELEYTLDGSEFLRNTQLLLGVPLTLGFGDYAGEGDIEFGWQQRWVKEEGLMPTLATLAEMRIPSGYEGSGVDGKFTGIVDKDIGPGTAYLNAFIITANGHEVDDLRHFQWGARAGYKWRITDALALLVDYVHQSSEETGHANSNTLEVSSEYKVTEHFSIGPGIVIGLDRNGETPYFGAGCRFVYTIK